MGLPRPAMPPDPDLVDHIVILRGVSFDEYEQLLAWRGERSVPRVTYLRGAMELMSPSRFHELDKTTLARALEAWSEERGLALQGFGSWTLKARREDRGAEPDECYVIAAPGRDLSKVERPDFAIEVVWTRGGLDKLEVYRKLGVREVWIYEDGRLAFHALDGEEWRAVSRSEVLPALDPSILEDAMKEPNQLDAVRLVRRRARETD